MMTTTKSLQSAGAVDPPNRRSKRVLFCQNCGHESPLNGDWIIDDKDGTYACPECRAAIGRGAGGNSD